MPTSFAIGRRDTMASRALLHVKRRRASHGAGQNSKDAPNFTICLEEDLKEEARVTSISRAFIRRFVEHHIEKGTVDFQPAVVVDKTQLPELVHKGVDPSPRGAHHFC
jgi:hypothetical protein